MRIAIAQIVQETNTFSPIVSRLTDFKQGGLHFGAEILDKMRGVGEIGGFLAAAEEASDVEPLPIVRAAAMSGGRLTDETLEFFERMYDDLYGGKDKGEEAD